MENSSKLEEIKDQRTVWTHEALDYTPWLSQDDSIALLADAVGLDITVDESVRWWRDECVKSRNSH